jgi:hypothetical protein
MMAGPDHSFHHHLSLNQGDGKGLILRSRLTPHEQVITLPKGWHRAITPHTHNKELLPLGPLWAHRDYRFDVLYREQRNAGSNLPHHGNVPDNIASRPCHRSTQGQAPCLERTSVEGALALKGSEVSLDSPDGDAKVLGQFPDCRGVSLSPELTLNDGEHPLLLSCERHSF